MKRLHDLTIPISFVFLFLVTGCGPSLKGIVVLPDGTPLKNPKVVVYTNPWTDSVKVKNDGTFALKKNIQEQNTYTIVAEDADGNMGFVKGYTRTKTNKNEKIVIRMSREMDAKEAVIEGGIYNNQDAGPGEKIFKSSQ